MTSALSIALHEGNFKELTTRVENLAQELRSSSCDFLMENLNFVATGDLKLDKNVDLEILEQDCGKKRYRSKTVKVKLIKTPRSEEKVPPTTKSKRRKKVPSQPAYNSYWVFPLHHEIRDAAGAELIQQNLPISFLWLLKQGAAVVESTPLAIYKELLIIEAHFLLEDNEEKSSNDCVKQMKYLKQYY
jgi:hypothetical protein